MPNIQITKIAVGKPLLFKIVGPVIPEIKLPDYKKIAVKENEVKLKMEEFVNDNEEDANIFKLLKKVPAVKSEKSENDNKIAILQNEVKTLNNKFDLILELLKNKNKN